MNHVPRTAMLSAACLLLLAACGDSEATTRSTTTTTTTMPVATTAPNGGGSWRADLDAARRRWAGAGIESYVLDLEASCFCPAPLTYRVEVVKGQVVSQSTGSVDLGQFIGSRAPTVEGLFATIDDLIARNPSELRVSYDAATGYPTSFWVDPVRQVADDEHGLTIALTKAAG